MRKIALMPLCLIILSFAPTSVTAQNSGQHFWQSIDKIGNYELAVIEQASGKSAQKFIDTSIAFKVSGSTRNYFFPIAETECCGRRFYLLSN